MTLPDPGKGKPEKPPKIPDPGKDEKDEKIKKEKRIKAWKAPAQGDPHPQMGKKLTKASAKALRATLKEERRAAWEATL